MLLKSNDKVRYISEKLFFLVLVVIFGSLPFASDNAGTFGDHLLMCGGICLLVTLFYYFICIREHKITKE